MKRDIDLARRLLIDIENHGIDCSVSVLRTGPNQETEERIRYHLRLLIDAGFLKEVDRTTDGVPCLRLTHDGHELLELARHEERWREAKWACHQRIGGLSLAVIRGLLVRWAVQGTGHVRRRPRPAYPYVEGRYADGLRDPAYRYEPFGYQSLAWDDLDWWFEDDARYVDARYVRARPEHRNGYRRAGVDLNGDGRVDVELETTLPDHLI